MPERVNLTFYGSINFKTEKIPEKTLDKKIIDNIIYNIKCYKNKLFDRLINCKGGDFNDKSDLRVWSL